MLCIPPSGSGCGNEVTVGRRISAPAPGPRDWIATLGERTVPAVARTRSNWIATLAACVAGAVAPASATAAVNPAPPPPLPVRAAALLEETTGQFLYGENPDAELPIASTTKLMTALVALHHAALGQVFSDPGYSFPPEDTQIYLQPGERMTVRDLLTAMLLPSADDAAEVLAYNVGGGSVARFVAMMNARARQLGLTHTHYSTPIGLDTPGNYSSAGDLVALARYDLLTEPFIRATVAEPGAILQSGNHVRYVTNRNDLVGRYWWINGVKTGHTSDAGYVLVASGTRVKGGMTLIGAVLGAGSMASADSAALALLNWGFSTFRLRRPVSGGQTFARPAVNGEPGRRVRLIAASTYAHVFLRGTRVRVRVKAPAELAGPLPRHAVVGFVRVSAGRRVVARIPLLLARRLA
jgi:D-alanyl-D-alanine carboxypeptidase (penicillin-binding protein 5/6)